MIVCCADIGSVAKKRFGWAAHPGEPDRKGRRGNDIDEFAQFVAGELLSERKVALGFECPLWIPIADKPSELGRARPGEGNRPWSAAAGAASLATGLAQVAWILDRIRPRSKDIEAFLDWRKFEPSQTGLFLWEAFVTGRAATGSHEGDALAAVTAFRRAMGDGEPKSAVKAESPTRSLIGAALLRTGWSTDLDLLRARCLVIKA